MANSAALEQAKQLREGIVNDLVKVERVLTDLETTYHQAEYSQAGNVLKGLDGFLASKENQRKRARGYKPEDRLFTLSSRSTPAVQEGDNGGLPGGEPGAGMMGGKKAMGAYGQKGYSSKGSKNVMK